VLEQKYQQVAQKLDKAELDTRNHKFQADLVTKENI